MKDERDEPQPGPTALLLGSATSLGAIGTFRWDLASDELCLSDRAKTVLGVSGESTPTAQRVIESAVHPDDRERAFELRERARTTAGRVPADEWLLTDPDGQLRWVTMTMTPAFEGSRATEMLGCVRDVSEGHDWLSEREIYLAAFKSLTEGTQPATGPAALITALVQALGWESGALWLSGDTGAPVCRAHWSRSGQGPPLPLPPPPQGPSRQGTLVVPVRAGTQMLGSLELERGSGRPLRPQVDEAVRAVAGLLGDFVVRHGARSGDSPLTARETEVLQLASHGGSSATIAERLVISPSTVKTHLEHIYAKLGMADRAGAVAEALRRRLID